MNWKPIATAPRDSTKVIIGTFKSSYGPWVTGAIQWRTDCEKFTEIGTYAEGWTHWHPMPDAPNEKNDPLTVNVTDNKLVIEIGIHTLAYSSVEAFQSYNDKRGRYETTPVIDAYEFAKDIAGEMKEEEEDGSTPLTRFLDQMMGKAKDNGSMALGEKDVPYDREADRWL